MNISFRKKGVLATPDFAKAKAMLHVAYLKDGACWEVVHGESGHRLILVLLEQQQRVLARVNLKPGHLRWNMRYFCVLYLLIYLPVYSSVCLLPVNLSVYLSVCLSINLSIYQTNYLSIFICLPISAFICLSIFLPLPDGLCLLDVVLDVAEGSTLTELEPGGQISTKEKHY